ncbi:MAG: SDR family oxidoreductase [Methyloligellaceae bacterium]
MSRLVCFGLGYSARVFAGRMRDKGWRVLGTTRSGERADALRAQGFEMCLFTGEAPSKEVQEALKQSTHVLVSIVPGHAGDPVLAQHANDLADAQRLEWIGYLSTVGVYGDHGGAWVDEDTPLKPSSERSVARAGAEREWLEFGAQADKAVHLFRLAGIYGLGRGPLENLRRGRARRIVKPGQMFNRIHVEDISLVLEASIARPRAGAIYNVTDDEPAPPQDVVAYAAELLGVEVPGEVAFEDADLSPVGRSFYGENKRVSNARIKQELGVKLSYPSYREGMRALAAHLPSP